MYWSESKFLTSKILIIKLCSFMMKNFSSKNFYNGLKIVLDGKPYIIESSKFIKPGKGQPFVRVMLRYLLTGDHIERTFKSSDSVESADVVDINFLYLYNDGKFWYFMNKNTLEQLTVSREVIGNNYKWLLDPVECTITLWDDKPIMIAPPRFVNLKVIYTDQGIKSTTTNSSKQAVLSTGITIKVPWFIKISDIIKVNTRSGEYVSRIK